MFHSARLRLTFWYLLIITFISFSFSLIIYRQVSLELERGFRVAEFRIRGQPIPQRGAQLMLAEELDEARNTVRFRLLLLNGIIISTAGIAGYFLAGKTLRPIEKMMEKQKRFIGDSSHELKTPLTAIRTEAEVALKNKKLRQSDSRKLLKSIVEETDKMHKLIDYLITLSRYESGEHSSRKTSVDLKKLIKNVSDKLKPLAKKKKIKLETRLEKVKVQGVEPELEQMITIFIENALKYTDKGSVKVSLNKKSRKAVVTVTDTGIGIDKKEIAYIFDRFYRADTSRSKNKKDGYGLGLSIAKTIVGNHNGEIKVESEVGVGTRFVVYLPA